MPHRAHNLNHAELLESMTWCQELAGRLARDVHRGEDAAQEVWLSALQTGSLRRLIGLRLRGWLGRSAWNRIRERRRSEDSRKSREEVTARPEAQESVLDVLERGEGQRRILEAVLSLPEPYASTVLQRYFDDLSCAQIARREGVSGEVVRKRLSRALERLRLKLERDFGGDRSWLAALALFPGPSRWHPAPSVSATAAPSVVRWVLGSVLFGAAGLWCSTQIRSVESTGSRHVPVVGAASRAGEETVSFPSTVPAADRRTPVVGPQNAPRAEEQPRVDPVLGGRALNAWGDAVAGIAVRGVPADATGVAPETKTRADGRFHLPAAPALERIVVAEPGLATVMAASGRRGGGNEAVLVVAPAIDLAGRVVDTSGQTLAGVRVTLVVPEGLGADFDSVLDHSVRLTFATRSGQEGLFDLGGVPWVEGLRLRLERERFETLALPIPRASNRRLLVTLEPQALPAAMIEGVVLGPDGRAVADALVSSGCDTTRSGPNGTFRVRASTPSCDLGSVRVSAIVRGYRPAWRDVDPDGPAENVVLCLPGRARALEGRVVDEQGAGVAGAKVWLADPTPFGVIGERLAFVESLQTSDDPALWDWVRSDAEGRFRIDGVDERRYEVAALDVATLVRSESSAEPGEEALVVLPTTRVTHDFKGRVEDVFGAPVAGATITLYRRTRHVRVGEAYEWVDEQPHTPVLTAQDGRFRLPVVPLEGARLYIHGEGLVPRHLLLDQASPVSERTFVVQPRTHLRVELTAAGSDIDRVRLLEADGGPVDVGILRGPELELTRAATFFGTRTHLLVVPRNAEFLALYAGEVEVHRAPLTLELGELNLVRH